MSKIKKLADKAIDLHLKIKSETLKLKKLKYELMYEMALNATKEVEVKDGKANIYPWKTRYANFLKKEFYKLNDEEKDNLFKTGLLKIHYRLDNKKFEEIKNKMEKTELDKFVKLRRNDTYLVIKLNDRAKDMLISEENELFPETIDPKVAKALDEIERERIPTEKTEDESFEKWVSRVRQDDIFNDPDYLSYFTDDEIIWEKSDDFQ